MIRLAGSLRQLVGYLIASSCHFEYLSLVTALNDQFFALKLFKGCLPTGYRPPIFGICEIDSVSLDSLAAKVAQVHNSAVQVFCRFDN